MNKPNKPIKVKRAKRGGGARTQPQEFVEAQVENARRAVERKLIYLSESNRASASTRAAKRSTAGAGGASGREGSSMAGQRRRRSKRNLVHGQAQEEPDEEESSPLEKTYNYENRRRSSCNLLLSPRRNGLTPRNYEAEAAELEAIMAAQKASSGATKPDQAEGDGVEYQGGAFGRLQLKPLSSYAADHQLPRYSCGVCGAKFHIRSLLGAHRHTHDDDFKVRFRGRRPRQSCTTLTVHLCKYCDRSFDLERTLHIHLLSYCKKIPPQQRRKLAFTELAHEKKAPLPNFQRAQQPVHQQGNSATKQQDQMTQQEKLHKIIMRESAVHERWR